MQTRTVTMGTNVFIGMAVTGNSTTTLATGTFDNVTVTGGGGGPTATPTNTPVSTNTPTPTSPGPTATPTATQSPTPSPTATNSGSTPTPTATATPPPNQPEIIVQRTTYTIAGQTVFLRVRTLEDNVEVSNDLYAMHTDHLGSTSTLSYLNPTDGSAGRVLDSRAFYTPFGDYRLEPTGDYTDQGYTGHLGNNSGSNDIGLIYMNARFYVSGIARFASADTIVPSPANPQSFNRYSYVDNSPINFSDPTGHCKNGRGTGPGTCHVDDMEPGVSIGTWRWYQEVAPKNGVQMHEMTIGELDFFIDVENRGNIPDAHGIGISGSASAQFTPMVSANIVGGTEAVFNEGSQEKTNFIYIGFGGSLGLLDTDGLGLEALTGDTYPYPKASFSGSIYHAGIYNIEENYDYRGSFDYEMGTVAHGLGVTGGMATTPRDNNLERPYSKNVGIAFGEGVSLDFGRMYYIPTFTYHNDTNSWSFPFGDYIKEILN